MNYECNNCEDSGHRFDTLEPCKECKRGEQIQHLQNITELNHTLVRANTLRVNILNYENKKL